MVMNKSHSDTRTERAFFSCENASSPSPVFHSDSCLPSIHLDDEIARVSREKQNELMLIKDTGWRDSIRQKIEDELSERVREALDPPSPDVQARLQRVDVKVDEINNDLIPNDEAAETKERRMNRLRHKRYVRRIMSMSSNNTRLNFTFKDTLSRTNDDMFPVVFGLDDDGFMESSTQRKFNRRMLAQTYSKSALLEAIQTGYFRDHSAIIKDEDGNYVDSRGILRTEDGPFWPPECTPMHAAPMFKWDTMQTHEPLWKDIKDNVTTTFDNQQTPYTGKWRSTRVVFDTEKTPANHTPSAVSTNICPNLGFESRFESGNLRQVRRVGQFEYELVLRTDLYTVRHTQWFFFRVYNAQPGIVYKFRIVNLLKKDSLYNHGMRPLMYSVKNVKFKNVGWMRTGHGIRYSRNMLHTQHPLLLRGVSYYELEWQMEFPHADDMTYLAHCYPYTFTDLRMDLTFFAMDHFRAPYLKEELLCETRIGNSCYVLTVTDYNHMHTSKHNRPLRGFTDEKKVVIVTARVHPGESNASWMMRGFIDYITGRDPTAQELRAQYIFKIIPMLNPDGVIVGNYRCSLSGRDLNRNYRRPRKETFPTVWHTKDLVEMMNLHSRVVLYCDLHGHSRKQNIFMYGNNTSDQLTGPDVTRAIVSERIFPWLVAQRCHDKFSFDGCKFQIRPCKEATGRVVMWRQLRIANSFTMEASFCGTTRSRETHHFNTSHLQRMGQMFGRVIHDFYKLRSDQSYEREIMLELACHLTRKILERTPEKPRPITVASIPPCSGDGLPKKEDVAAGRQLLKEDEKPDMTNKLTRRRPLPHPDIIVQPTNITASNITATNVSATSINATSINTTSINATSINTTSINATNINATNINATNINATSINATSINATNMASGSPMYVALDERRSTLITDECVDKVINNVSPATLDGCLQLLHQLNVSQNLVDSDSSDSDSETEAEMKPTKNKPRKKKRRKHKKSLKKQEVMKLADDKSLKFTEETNQKANKVDEQAAKTDLRIKSTTMKSSPLFISKYEGRHNNGIPCFSEERSQERAFKRLCDIPLENFDQLQSFNPCSELPPMTPNCPPVDDDVYFGNSEKVGTLNYPTGATTAHTQFTSTDPLTLNQTLSFMLNSTSSLRPPHPSSGSHNMDDEGQLTSRLGRAIMSASHTHRGSLPVLKRCPTDPDVGLKSPLHRSPSLPASHLSSSISNHESNTQPSNDSFLRSLHHPELVTKLQIPQPQESHTSSSTSPSVARRAHDILPMIATPTPSPTRRHRYFSPLSPHGHDNKSSAGSPCSDVLQTRGVTCSYTHRGTASRLVTHEDHGKRCDIQYDTCNWQTQEECKDHVCLENLQIQPVLSSCTTEQTASNSLNVTCQNDQIDSLITPLRSDHLDAKETQIGCEYVKGDSRKSCQSTAQKRLHAKHLVTK